MTVSCAIPLQYFVGNEDVKELLEGELEPNSEEQEITAGEEEEEAEESSEEAEETEEEAAEEEPLEAAIIRLTAKNARLTKQLQLAKAAIPPANLDGSQQLYKRFKAYHKKYNLKEPKIIRPNGWKEGDHADKGWYGLLMCLQLPKSS